MSMEKVESYISSGWRQNEHSCHSFQNAQVLVLWQAQTPMKVQ